MKVSQPHPPRMATLSSFCCPLCLIPTQPWASPPCHLLPSLLRDRKWQLRLWESPARDPQALTPQPLQQQGPGPPEYNPLTSPRGSRPWPHFSVQAVLCPISSHCCPLSWEHVGWPCPLFFPSPPPFPALPCGLVLAGSQRGLMRTWATVCPVLPQLLSHPAVPSPQPTTCSVPGICPCLQKLLLALCPAVPEASLQWLLTKQGQCGSVAVWLPTTLGFRLNYHASSRV